MATRCSIRLAQGFSLPSDEIWYRLKKLRTQGSIQRLDHKASKQAFSLETAAFLCLRTINLCFIKLASLKGSQLTLAFQVTPLSRLFRINNNHSRSTDIKCPRWSLNSPNSALTNQLCCIFRNKTLSRFGTLLTETLDPI